MTHICSIATVFALILATPVHLNADLITVINSSFEDTSGQTVFNEFTFGDPVGWQRYDPNGISGAGVFIGTLLPNGVDFFNSTAPDGDRVAILFNSQREGDGEYGLFQNTSSTIEANTRYELSVEVGNIASGFATNGTFFNLDDFPGYRVELLADGNVIAVDDNGLSIDEGEWGTSVISFESGAADPFLGQTLGIRLVNENVIPGGLTQGTSPDLEVDFDDVRLIATAIPEPSTCWMLFAALVSFVGNRRKNAE